MILNCLIRKEIKYFFIILITACFGVRHLQIVLLFFGLTVAYAMRVNLSVAIVAMTDDDRPNENVDYFMWKESTQSLILSSFFWGYVITQIPAGQLVEKYGAKMLLLFALTICSTLNILVPLCASFGGWKVITSSTCFKILNLSIFSFSLFVLYAFVKVSVKDSFSPQLTPYSQNGLQFQKEQNFVHTHMLVHNLEQLS